MNYKERMDELVRQLNEANYRYYVLDDPQMLDFEYDHHFLPRIIFKYIIP